MVVHEALQGLGLLDRVQILAEEVLDQRDLGVVVAFDEDGRNGGEARLARRGAAPLFGDDLHQAGFSVLPADDRFDDADLADGGGQFFEGQRVQVFPGLRRIGLELGQRDLVELIRCVRRHEWFLLPGERKKGRKRCR
jgi:hypothetical protein